LCSQAQAVDSGTAGLKALLNGAQEGAAYNVVLLDWHMPEMDGLAMLRQLGQSHDIYLPPVVLMVATAEIEQAVTASAEFNIDGIIAKPLMQESLYQAVVKALMADKSAVDLMPLASAHPFEGLHFLVAEDNDLNREVIEQILINAGAQVRLVVNGQLAVDALKASDVHFDAVLMDVQMPVMDGYTATRQIRESLGLLDLPIIALTAHARPQDREKSRLAGMSGHLVKPLDVQALLDLVTHVVGLRSSKLPTPKTSTHLVDLLLPGLNFGEAVKVFGGDPVVYAELLNKFMAMQSNDVVEARHRFSSGNSKGAISLLHDLSGVAGMLQALDLSRLAATAESAMRDKKTENLPGLLDEMQASMDTIKTSIEQLEAALL
jgi:CheY-like chemotaxis protein